MKVSFLFLSGLLISAIANASDGLSVFGIENLSEYVVKSSGIILNEDTTIQAERIRIGGPIVTKGHRLTLISYNIHFEKEGAIYTFQNDNMPAILEQCIPSVARPKTRENLPDLGNPPLVKGATKGSSASKGVDGKNGEKGLRGYKGRVGSIETYPINLVAQSITGEVKVFGNGQPGGDGGDGGKGQNGQIGGKGGKGFATCGAVIFGGSKTRRSGDGGKGGIGGAGGDGGEGGLGGLNTEINVLSTNKVDGVIESLPGLNGTGGSRGENGKHGKGGEPGDADHDKKTAKVGLVTVTLCSENSGTGSHGHTVTDLKKFNGNKPLHGDSPLVNGHEYGCFNVRGEAKAVVKEALPDLGHQGSEIRQNLKKTFLLKRFYTLIVGTILSVNEMKDYLDLLGGQVEFQNNYKDEVVKQLRSIWKDRFITVLSKSDATPLGESFKKQLETQADEVISALSLLETGDTDGASRSFARISQEMVNLLSGTINKNAKDCMDFRGYRDSSLKKVLDNMTQRSDPSDVKACVESNGFSSREDVDKNQVLTKLESILKEANKRYITFDEAKTVYHIPFCDDASILKVDNPESFASFLERDIDLTVRIEAKATGSLSNPENCHINLSQQNDGDGLNKKFSLISRKDPAEIDLVIHGVTFNEKVVHGLMGKDDLHYSGKKLSKLPGIKLSDLNLRKIENELFITAIMLGGAK